MTTAAVRPVRCCVSRWSIAGDVSPDSEQWCDHQGHENADEPFHNVSTCTWTPENQSQDTIATGRLVTEETVHGCTNLLGRRRRMAEYGEWNRKGATLSDVTAQREFGVSRDFIVKGIRSRQT